MSSEEQNETDQELLGLLQELAIQKDRTLLNSSSVGSPESSTDASSEAPIDLLGLSPLERHLTLTHREALGRLFAEACFRLLVSHKTLSGMLFLNHDKSGDEIAPVGELEWRKRKLALDEVAPDMTGLDEPLKVLEHLMTDTGSYKPDLLTVAYAGSMVAPSEALRIYRGYGLLEQGRTKEANQIFQAIYSSPQLPANKRCAAQLIAQLANLAQSYEHVCAWSELAATACDPEPNYRAVLAWVFAAIQAGNHKSLQRASDVLAVLNGDESIAQGYLDRVQGRLLTGHWTPTPQAMRLTLSAPRQPDDTQRVMDLFRNYKPQAPQQNIPPLDATVHRRYFIGGFLGSDLHSPPIVAEAPRAETLQR
ncbi:MAG: hypothetical protein ACI8X5_002866 [Planctomycetota bacterium]